MLASRAWWLLATLAEPAVLLLLRRRLARGKELAERIAERQGRATLPRPEGRLLWLHAASVGEAMSILSLLDALCQQDQTLNILVTTGSVTSERVLAQRLPALHLADRVRHQFVPLDVPRWLLRFLKHWQPQGLALVESELWPNLIACAYRAGVPIALVNARLSMRSYRSWRSMPGLARTMLRRFRWITARSDEDAARLRALAGVVVESPGDLKAAAPALPVDEAELARLRGLLAGRPILLAASTHAGEEQAIGLVHDILAGSFPDLLTIIAPRHPERGAAIAAGLGGAPRRTLGQDPRERFWICDSLGEMGLLYRLASVVFIGNSLEVVRPGGGHNPFEPARIGCALAIGPRSFNFNDGVRALLKAGALSVAPTPEAIARWARHMLADGTARRDAAEAGRRVANEAANLAPMLAARLLALARDTLVEDEPC